MRSALNSLIALRLPPELAAFQQELRAFMREEMAPERLRGHFDATDLTGLDDAFERAHHRRAGERGYLGISAPREYGGGGRPPSWKAVYNYEAGYADAPSVDAAITLCLSPMLRFGTAEQRARWIPPMVRGEITGCIAYSEKNAGNDLGALNMTAARVPATAERISGGWKLHGEKALVTAGHKADLCCTLARSTPGVKPREAMSVFAFALPHPGVTVRRRPTLNGWTLSELVFDDAVLPDDALIGPAGAGWSVVLSALGDERGGMTWLGWATRQVEELLAHHDHPSVAALAVDLAAARRICQRVLRMQDEGQPVTWEAAMSKVYVTELLQRIARTGVDLEADRALRWSPLFQGGSRRAYELLERMHCTISVGSNEMQRDGIARAALGLPAR